MQKLCCQIKSSLNIISQDLRSQLSDPLFLKRLYNDVEQHSDDDANLMKELENVIYHAITKFAFVTIDFKMNQCRNENITTAAKRDSF